MNMVTGSIGSIVEMTTQPITTSEAMVDVTAMAAQVAFPVCPDY